MIPVADRLRPAALAAAVDTGAQDGLYPPAAGDEGIVVPDRAPRCDVGGAVNELDIAKPVLPGRLHDGVGPRLDLVDRVAVPVDPYGLGVRIDLDRAILLHRV